MNASAIRYGCALLALAFAPALFAAGFTGIYQGQMDGVDAQLTLSESELSISGEIRLANGYLITLSGARRGDAVAGTAASVAGAATFSIERSAEGMTLELEETGPLTGHTIRMALAFRASAPASGGEVPADASIDPRLAGLWRGTELRAAGDMVLRTAIAVELAADGSYREADDAGSGTLADPAQGGRWRVSEGKLQLQAAGATQWKVLGFYLLRGDVLQLIDGAGNARTWRRR